MTAPPPSNDHVDGPDPSLLFLDLELTRGDRLVKIGAVRGSDTLNSAPDSAAWTRLAEMARGATALVGHNLIAHDLDWLRRHRGDHPVVQPPAVDTLWLSPLAFPERPYHRLLKEDKLLRDYLPDPLADCHPCGPAARRGRSTKHRLGAAAHIARRTCLRNRAGGSPTRVRSAAAVGSCRCLAPRRRTGIGGALLGDTNLPGGHGSGPEPPGLDLHTTGLRLV